MSLLFAALIALQQTPSLTSPPAGDTVGYWQQGVRYRIVAGLDERLEGVRATGELVYLNNSPDTLRELYVHQYLNAFRPGSRWAADDAREGRVRFQALRDPDFGYERFTAPPLVNGTAVRVDYPYAPDSTVARLALPEPLPPGDSVRVLFQWEARPSTLPRRQGRRGRHYDFAQWYPRVAVYDRGGWQANPLRPAGEFYGEFGDYDVTLLVRDDQVLGATGVPVEGDPGWERARRWGTVAVNDEAYRPVPPGPDTLAVPPGFRKVRFLARDVHHFAWTADPEYIYEGGTYDGRVPIHVLYRPGDEDTWGGGIAVQRTDSALAWLESIFGRYPYPQVTNVHRLEGGGTEFPMLMMNGSPSYGLILHELGHIYTHGILANNEWRAGWLDEGLSSYQTAWAQRLTAQDRFAGRAAMPARRPGGYAGLALTPDPDERTQADQAALVLTGRAQPLGTVAHQFSEFGIYNRMIYTRAAAMFGQLRDVMGDSLFREFLRTYYDRWRFRHVDRLALQRTAEDVYGRPLDWFFDQWVDRVGLLDYALQDVDIRRAGDRWRVRARVERTGHYRHPVPVGVRTASGWIIARADPLEDEQWVDVTTAERPLEVRLDPFRVTEDWDRRNDVLAGAIPLVPPRTTTFVFDWPFVDQWSRERRVVSLTPLVWYSDPGGIIAALRARSNYLGLVDRWELGLALASHVPDARVMEFASGPNGPVTEFTGDVSRPLTRLQGWAVWENPRLGDDPLPLMGFRAGVWALSGIAKVELRQTEDRSPFLFARSPLVTRRYALTATLPYDRNWLPTDRWEDVPVADASAEFSVVPPERDAVAWRLLFMGGARGLEEPAVPDGAPPASGPTRSWSERFFARVEAEARTAVHIEPDGSSALLVRGFLGASIHAPRQRAIGASAVDATTTYENHLYRPAGGLLSGKEQHFTPLGGAGMRGYSPLLRVQNVLALNIEWRHELGRRTLGGVVLEPALALFGDVGRTMIGSAERDPFQVPELTTMADAGVALVMGGRLWDRALTLRADFPLWVRQARLAIGGEPPGGNEIRFRWALSLRDLW